MATHHVWDVGDVGSSPAISTEHFRRIIVKRMKIVVKVIHKSGRLDTPAPRIMKIKTRYSRKVKHRVKY